MYIFLIILTSEVKMIKLTVTCSSLATYFSALTRITANQSPFYALTPPSFTRCWEDTVPWLVRYFSGHTLILSLILCLQQSGWWQTDCPCRRAGPNVEGAESPNRAV